LTKEERIMSLGILADRYLEINGTKMRFWILGESESPIFLLHGLRCYVEYWRDNISFLAKRHRVIAIDLPGFGLSDKPHVIISIPYLTEFVRQFLDAIGVDRTVLVGASMGGAIALRSALQHSDRVEELVLAGSAGLGRRYRSCLGY
jgi:pimeloyl-ACP methyl ester carboxylesterase